MEDNIFIEVVNFNEKLYEKNIKEHTFNTEYEAGEDDANN